MRKTGYINGSTLPTVLVICVLMLLIVLGIISVSGNFASLRFRTFYQKNQRSFIESGFVLYKNIFNFSSQLAQDSSFILFKERKQSRIFIESRLWGLFDLVSVYNNDRTISSTRFLGYRQNDSGLCFYYADNNSPLYVTGNTNLYGKLKLPAFGLKYSQLQSTFFSGEEVDAAKIERSDKLLPEPDRHILNYLNSLYALLTDSSWQLDYSDSILNNYCSNPPIIIGTNKDVLSDIFLKGNIILLAKNIIINKSAHLEDVIVVADKIIIEKEFIGIAQFFAKDTIILEKGVTLNYPSGLFISKRNKNRYISIENDCSVKGYIIVDGTGETDIKYPNYKQSQNAIVQGFLYVNGIAQIQGYVYGESYLKKAVYYSKDGYYDNTIFNASFIDTCRLVSPLWLSSDTNNIKQESKWVR